MNKNKIPIKSFISYLFGPWQLVPHFTQSDYVKGKRTEHAIRNTIIFEHFSPVLSILHALPCSDNNHHERKILSLLHMGGN